MLEGIFLIRVFVRVVASLQVIGASASAVMLLPRALGVPRQFLSILMLIIMYSILAVAFVSGMWLWNYERRGFRTALAVQALQIPIISTTFLTYQFAFGFGFILLFSWPKIDFNFYFGSRSFLYLFEPSASTSIGFNIFAIIVLAFLTKYSHIAQINSEFPTNNSLR